MEAEEPGKMYPPFVRDGQRLVPVWVTHHVGDTIYDITNDAFSICLKEHTVLSVRHESAMGEPNSGFTPRELGYVADYDHSCPPYMCSIPKWVGVVGIGKNDFAAAIVALMGKRTGA